MQPQSGAPPPCWSCGLFNSAWFHKQSVAWVASEILLPSNRAIVLTFDKKRKKDDRQNGFYSVHMVCYEEDTRRRKQEENAERENDCSYKYTVKVNTQEERVLWALEDKAGTRANKPEGRYTY